MESPVRSLEIGRSNQHTAAARSSPPGKLGIPEWEGARPLVCLGAQQFLAKLVLVTRRKQCKNFVTINYTVL